MATPKQLQNCIPDGNWFGGLKAQDKKNWEKLLAHGVKVFAEYLQVADLHEELITMEKVTFEIAFQPMFK